MFFAKTPQKTQIFSRKMDLVQFVLTCELTLWSCLLVISVLAKEGVVVKVVIPIFLICFSIVQILELEVWKKGHDPA